MTNKNIYFGLSAKKVEQALARGSLYKIVSGRDEIQKHQADKFNKIWKDAYQNLPFYKKWKKENDLPDEISSIGELLKWPIVTKKYLQHEPESLMRHGVLPSGFVRTGGSTGEPLCLGSWGDSETGVSQWLGRAAYGVLPCERTFLLWGHAHLYGKGLLRQYKITKRKIADYFSNYRRCSAYDLSIPAMRTAFAKYITYNPSLVIGFSPAILAFCRINRVFGNKIVAPPKTVLCTAGPLNSSEKSEISDFFSAPVCMEYGSAECGVMAYTVPQTDEYQVFWDTHLLQGHQDEHGEMKNIVTRLTSCYFPLIRYDIGDYLELANFNHLDSILTMRTVKGRPSEIVTLKNGVSFFGATIGDCVKQVSSIISSQLFVSDAGLRIDVVATDNLSEADKSLIRSRFNAVVKGMDACHVEIQQVEKLRMTQGGKTPLVVRE